MLELLAYDARKRLRGSLYLSLGMAVLAAVVIWFFPSFRDAFEDQDFTDAYPDAATQLFGIESMTSIEGFLAVELYVFGWVILLGLYLAYSAAGIIADDVDRGRIDSLLALPISRPRLLAERFAGLGVPILLVNVITPPVVYVSVRLIGESLSVADLLAVHLLSIPFLFACAGVGILASVLFDRVGIAQRVALATVFVLFLVESLAEGTPAEAVGYLAPMHYFDPNQILLEGSYDVVGAGVLVVMTLVVLGVSQVVFVRKDIS